MMQKSTLPFNAYMFNPIPRFMSASFKARGAPPPRALRASRDALRACRRYVAALNLTPSSHF